MAAVPLVSVVTPFIYEATKALIPYLLILVSVFLIWRERKSRFWAFFIFSLSGILGIAVLNFPNLSQPLFPLFSGLFGTSTLLFSFHENAKIPKQIVSEVDIGSKEAVPAIVTSVGVGAFVFILPGLGPSQAAIIGAQIARKLTSRGFMMMVGGLNTVNMLMSFVTLYSIEKARNGAVVIISQFLETFNVQLLVLFIGIILLVGGIATFLTIKLTKVFSKIIVHIPYRSLVLSVLGFIALLVFLISGFYGFIILVTATFVGMLPSLQDIGKNHLMGSLILPIILFFLL